MFSKNEQSVVSRSLFEGSSIRPPSVFSAKLVTSSSSDVARNTRPAPSSSALNTVEPPAGAKRLMQSTTWRASW